MAVPLNQFDPNNPKRKPKFTTIRERMAKENVGFFAARRINKEEQHNYYRERTREKLKPENITKSVFGRTLGTRVAIARGASQEDVYRVAGIAQPKKPEHQATYRDNPRLLKQISQNTSMTNELLSHMASMGGRGPGRDSSPLNVEREEKKKRGLLAKTISLAVKGGVLMLILDNKKTRFLMTKMFTKVLVGLSLAYNFTKGFYNGILKRDGDGKRRSGIFETLLKKTLIAIAGRVVGAGVVAATPAIAATGAAYALAKGYMASAKALSLDGPTGSMPGGPNGPKYPKPGEHGQSSTQTFNHKEVDKDTLPWEADASPTREFKGKSDVLPPDEDLKKLSPEAKDAMLAKHPEWSEYVNGLNPKATQKTDAAPDVRPVQPTAVPKLDSSPMYAHMPKSIVPIAMIEKKQDAHPIPTDDIPPEGKALLDTIASTESPDYNTIVGGGHFDSYADHPRKVGMVNARGQKSTAAGKYQITETTWDELRKKHPDLNDFSPHNQDKAAWYLAQQRYKGDLSKDLKDPSKIKGVSKALNKTWNSLPGGDQSAYDFSLKHPLAPLMKPFDKKYADNLQQNKLNTGSVLAQSTGDVDNGKSTNVIAPVTNNTITNNQVSQNAPSNNALPPVRSDENSYRRVQDKIVRAGLF